MVWLAEQLMDAPGARSATGVAGVQSRSETCGSDTTTRGSGTFREFRAVIVEWMTSTTGLKPDSVASLVIDSSGFCSPSVVTSSHLLAAPPWPSSTHAWL